jgi:hypothetical protein
LVSQVDERQVAAGDGLRADCVIADEAGAVLLRFEGLHFSTPAADYCADYSDDEAGVYRIRWREDPADQSLDSVVADSSYADSSYADSLSDSSPIGALSRLVLVPATRGEIEGGGVGLLPPRYAPRLLDALVERGWTVALAATAADVDRAIEEFVRTTLKSPNPKHPEP